MHWLELRFQIAFVKKRFIHQKEIREKKNRYCRLCCVQVQRCTHTDATEPVRHTYIYTHNVNMYALMLKITIDTIARYVYQHQYIREKNFFFFL